MRSCFSKQLMFHQNELRKHRKERGTRPVFPRLWILSPRCPRAALDGYGLQPMPGWPVGFFEAPPLFAFGLVVLSDLEKTRDTPLLRLMGTSPDLNAAIRELQALEPGAWEQEAAEPGLLDWHRQRRYSSTPDEEDLRVQLERVYDKVVRESREDGLQRAHRQDVLAVLRERGLTVTPAQQARIEACPDISTAQRWLRRAVTARATDEIFVDS